MPWFWLEHKPGWPAVFGDRLEGFLAPMPFSGDLQRLAADGADVLVTMTRTHDGKLLRINPGLRGQLADLRFDREQVESLAAAKAGQEHADAPDTSATATGTDMAQTTAQQPRVRAPCLSWQLTRPKRLPGYRAPLHQFLQAAHRSGQGCPTAIDVLDTWRITPPADVTEVLATEFKYQDSHGSTKAVSLRSLQRAIDRLVTKAPST